MKASDSCTQPVLTTSEIADVDDAIGVMNSYGIRRVVVVDDKDGKVVGVLTTDDLWRNFRSLSEELAVKITTMSRSKRT